METSQNDQSDEEKDEFEVEAEQAFANVMKSNAEKQDDFDEDEFGDAFASYGDKKVNSTIPDASKMKAVAQNCNPVSIKSKTDDAGRQPKSCDEKTGSEMTPIQDASSERDKPPLPEFALDLITRKKSLKDEPLSPAHSAKSNESSERGWSSDPDSYRHKPQKSLNETKEEWEHVETVTAGIDSGIAKSPMVSFKEAIFHFQNANMDEYAASIKPTIRHRGLGALWNAIAGPPKIHERLKEDRDLIFILALCPFDNHEAMHLMILQTIYKKLTATDLDCPRYGTHWESIGFQGQDPSTDLRGCGMLGLLTILNFVTSPQTSNLAKDVYRLSEDEVQNFPFSVMGINITRITLQTFREGKLNKECNACGQIFEVFCELYSSIYFTIYWIWKTECKSISDSGFVIQEIEARAKKNPIMLMKNFRKAMNERKKGKLPTDVQPALKDKNMAIEKVEKFVGLCDLDSKGDEEVHLV